jgi:predicted kinase
VRLTPDDWILALYGAEVGRDVADAVRGSVEALQWELARRLLGLGQSVVLDFGFWTRAERAAYRREAERLGARVTVEFRDATVDELWWRIARRPESRAGTLAISRAELETWAALFEPPTPDELSAG